MEICYKIPSLLNKNSAGYWDLYVIAMVNTGNDRRPFPSKPSDGLSAWDLNIYYTVFSGDSKSGISQGTCQGEPLGTRLLSVSGRHTGRGNSAVINNYS